MFRKILQALFRTLALACALPCIAATVLVPHAIDRFGVSLIPLGWLFLSGYVVGRLLYFARTGKGSGWAGLAGVLVAYTQVATVLACLFFRPSIPAEQVAVVVVAASALPVALIHGARVLRARVAPTAEAA